VAVNSAVFAPQSKNPVVQQAKAIQYRNELTCRRYFNFSIKSNTS